MDIILIQDVERLGTAGQIVPVSAGYARNYLFPRRLAEAATKTSRRRLAEMLRQRETSIAREKLRLEKRVKELAKVSVTAQVRVGEDDRVFGAVTAQNVADLLVQQGHQFDRKEIVLTDPLKALGQYDVEVRLGHGISGQIKVWVVRE